MIQRIPGQAINQAPNLKAHKPYTQPTNFHSDGDRTLNITEKAREIARAPRNDQDLTDIRELLISNLEDRNLSGALKELNPDQADFLKEEGVITEQGKFDQNFLLEFRAQTIALPELQKAS